MNTMFRITLLSLFGMLIIGSSAAVEFTDVLPSYVSRHNVLAGPRSTQYFSAHLCGGCAYDGRKATVSLNLPQHMWDNESGDYLRVYVSSASGNEVANNILNTKEQLSEFSFMYRMEYSDLKIKVVTGPATSFTYKVVVSFGKAADKMLNCKNRTGVTKEEAMLHRQFEKEVKQETSNSAINLVPIFRFNDNGVVETNADIGYELHYCFPEDLPYNILFNILATDDTSGFFLFACPSSVESCTDSAQIRVLTGGSTVYLKFAIESASDSGPVRVIVKGNGRLGQKNNFRLYASTYYKGNGN